MKNLKYSKVIGYTLAALLTRGLASAAGAYQLPVVSEYVYRLPSPVSPNLGLPVRLPAIETPLIVIGAPIALPSPINDPIIDDYRLSPAVYSPIAMRAMPASSVLPVIEETPVLGAAGKILHGADRKGADQKALDKAFDNIKLPEEAPIVDAKPVKKTPNRSSRPITLPEAEFDEIGLP